jgi:hypothetical protein
MANINGIEQTCHIANTPSEWIKQIKELEDQEFTTEDFSKRKKLLQTFNGKKGAETILSLMFPNE